MQALPKVQLDIDLGRAQRAKLHSMHSQVKSVFYPYVCFFISILVVACCACLLSGIISGISMEHLKQQNSV